METGVGGSGRAAFSVYGERRDGCCAVTPPGAGMRWPSLGPVSVGWWSRFGDTGADSAGRTLSG